MMRSMVVLACLAGAGFAAAQDALGVLEALTRHQNFRTMRESSANPDLSRNGDAKPIPAGETLVLGDLEGPGVVTHIWCTVGTEDPLYPSVEAPGWYQVSAIMQHQLVGGVYQAFVNDLPVGGPRDFHDIGEGIFWESFDLWKFEPGTQVLRFNPLGRSPNHRAAAPTLNALLMQHFILLRLEDMEGFKAASTRVRAEQAAERASAASGNEGGDESGEVE